MISRQAILRGQTPAVSKLSWWVFAAMVLLLNAPNLLPWERHLYPDSWLFDASERLLKCLLLSAAFLALFARPWMAWLWGWLLFGWWMPFSLGTRWISDSPITSSLMGMAMASSPGELLSLLGSLSPVWLGSFILWNVTCIAILVVLRRCQSWRWSLRPRLTIILVVAGLFILPWLLQREKTTPREANADVNSPADPFATADAPIGLDGDLPFAFPYELPWSFLQYWRARAVVDTARAALKPLPVDQGLHPEPSAPEVVVLVIGESSSRSAWQLFSPSAPATTPRLSARAAAGGGLYRFRRVVAQSTSTRQAVPSMLTPQPLLWPDGKPNPTATRSIVSLAGNAGYSTAWFSNQSAVGRFDGVIAAYADEAQTKAFLNPSSFFQQGSLDEVLLPALRNQLAKRQRAFVVLHTMGSHFQFEHRYPKGFGPYAHPKNSSQHYFNSIAYTDALLDQIISLLEKDGRPAVMLYVSDHGQGLADGRCKKADVNRSTLEAYEVPALTWLSEGFMERNPGVVSRLQRNVDAPYTTSAVYQTLRDLIAGTTDGAAVAAPSFLRQPLTGVPQMVVAPSMRWVDLNEAAARDPCLIKAP